jgi:hypothetical protein
MSRNETRQCVETANLLDAVMVINSFRRILIHDGINRVNTQVRYRAYRIIYPSILVLYEYDLIAIVAPDAVYQGSGQK